MMSVKTRNLLYYSFFTLQAITVAGLLWQGNSRPVYDVAIVILLFLVYLYFERKMNLQISNYIRGSMLLTLTIHTFVGKLLNFYQTVPPFDNVLHIYGAYSVALFSHALAVQRLRVEFATRLNRFIFIILIGMCAGAIYEILEFLLDVGLKPTIPNQASLLDTDLDMVSDLIGSITAAYQKCYIKSKSVTP